MIPVARPAIGRDEIDAVVRVLESGNLRFGELSTRFERSFAVAEGGAAAVAVNSGTAALHCAYAALLAPGDEVLVPAFTFVATASMVAAVGAKPVFCDVDPATGLITPEEIERRRTPRTKAVAPVHLYGNPVPLEPLRRAAEGLRIVWDAAQSQGARWGGGGLASVGDAVCYSFYPTKNMTTGEGGMVVLADPDLEGPIRQVSDHGRLDRYSHARLGFNYRMTDLAAAIGLGQLERLSGWLERRRRIADRYREALAGVEGLAAMAVDPLAEPAWCLHTLRIDPAVVCGGRDAFQAALAVRGIGAAVHYPLPLHRQPMFTGLDTPPLPGAEQLADRVLSLPLHPDLSEGEVERVVTACREAADELAG